MNPCTDAMMGDCGLGQGALAGSHSYLYSRQTTGYLAGRAGVIGAVGEGALNTQADWRLEPCCWRRRVSLKVVAVV